MAPSARIFNVLLSLNSAGRALTSVKALRAFRAHESCASRCVAAAFARRRSMIAGAGGIHRLTQLLGREMTMDALVNSRRALRARDGTSLHGALEWLRQEGDLIETQREVNPDLEI